MNYRYSLTLFLILSAGYCSAQGQFWKLNTKIQQCIVKNHIIRNIRSTTLYDNKGAESSTSRVEISFDTSGNIDEWEIYDKEKFIGSLKFAYYAGGAISWIINYDAKKRLYSASQYELDSRGNPVSFTTIDKDGKTLANEKVEYDEKNQLVKKFKSKKHGPNKFYMSNEFFYNEKAECIIIKSYSKFKNLTTTTVHEYDTAGNLILIKSFKGKKITEFQQNKYNERKLLVESYWPEGWEGKDKITKIIYTYDERGLEIEQKNYREDKLVLKTITTYLGAVSTLNPQPRTLYLSTRN